MTAFWKEMERNNYAWLYNATGARQDPLVNKLPTTVEHVSNDAYRSLAYILRQYGGYAKSASSFSEFRWANYLRNVNGLQLPVTTNITKERDAVRNILGGTLPKL